MQEYLIITPENLPLIKRRINKDKNGRLILGHPAMMSFWPNALDSVDVDLFDSPVANSEDFYVRRGTEERNGEDWQTNWEKDRHYKLRFTPKPSKDALCQMCRGLGDKLIFGPYEFSIGFQGIVGRGFFTDGGITLYVPPAQSLEPALAKAFIHVAGLLNSKNEYKITSEHLDQIVEYVMNDLSTGEVFARNVQAGVAADKKLGM